MDDKEYIDIAIKELNYHIDMLNRLIADTANGINVFIEERNKYMRTINILEKLKYER